MKTFSNMGTAYLILTAQAYCLAIQTLTRKRFLLIRDENYNKKFETLTAKIQLLTDLQNAALAEAGLPYVPAITD